MEGERGTKPHTMYDFAGQRVDLSSGPHTPLPVPGKEHAKGNPTGL